jgi:hypothetical protein
MVSFDSPQSNVVRGPGGHRPSRCRVVEPRGATSLVVVGKRGSGRKRGAGTLSLPRLRHPFRALALLAVPALLAVGCGGSPSTGNHANQGSDVQLQRYVQCMNQHGVHVSVSNGQPVIGPAPNSAGASPGGNAPETHQAVDPQVQAADNACKQYRPNGGTTTDQPSAQQLDQMAKYVHCLNQHGIPAQLQGSRITLPSGSDPRLIKQDAPQACKQYLPH